MGLRQDAYSVHSDLQSRLCILLRGQDTLPSPYQAATEASGGRPRFVVTEGQIERLLKLGFTKTRMSELLGISRWTLWRRMNELHFDQAYDDISDDELDNIVGKYRTDHPFTGWYYNIEIMNRNHFRQLHIPYLIKITFKCVYVQRNKYIQWLNHGVFHLQ